MELELKMDLYMFKDESENKKSILRTIFKSNSLSRNALADAVGFELSHGFKACI